MSIKAIRQAFITFTYGSDLNTSPDDEPKLLLQLGGRPFLGHLLWNLARYGITEIVISAGDKRPAFEKTIGDGSTFGVNVSYLNEKESSETATILRRSLPRLDERFFLVDARILFDLNYLDLGLLLNSGALAAQALKTTGTNTSKYRSGGVVALEKSLITHLPEDVQSLEDDVLPRLGHSELAAKTYDGFFMDIRDVESLKSAQASLSSWSRKPAVFLDRDGVINRDHGYVYKPEEYDWMPGAKEAVKLINDSGMLAIVFTNQSGIARGYYTREQLASLSDWIQEELVSAGAHLDDVYFCPHHPEGLPGPDRKVCDCRKPEPGMIFSAAEKWNVDLARSHVIGDKPWDLEAGERAGIPHRHLFTGDDIHSFITEKIFAFAQRK